MGLKIQFNSEIGVWELIEISTKEVLDHDAQLSELEKSYPKALLILPGGK